MLEDLIFQEMGVKNTGFPTKAVGRAWLFVYCAGGFVSTYTVVVAYKN